MFVRHGSIYVRVNQCNLLLVNDSVKEKKKETVDNNCQDLHNNYKQNQNIDTNMMFKMGAKNVSREFEEQKEHENKDV